MRSDKAEKRVVGAVVIGGATVDGEILSIAA